MVTVHAAGPPVGLVVVTTWPGTPTATHRELEAHDTANRTLLASTFDGVQLVPSVGSVDVRTLPVSSTATHSDVDGQDTPRSTWVPSTLATVHFPAPPVGSVEVTTLPAPSTAAQREDDGQDIGDVQVLAALGNPTPIERSTMNSWDDKNFVAAVQKTSRKKIVLSGLWTETCVALPTIQAIHDNYDVYVVEDCCGDVSQLAHDNAMRRIVQAGARPVTVLSVMLEWQRDWAHKGTYDAVMDIVKAHYGAYGAGVEYAYTMVHGAPATELPAYRVPDAARTHK